MHWRPALQSHPLSMESLPLQKELPHSIAQAVANNRARLPIIQFSSIQRGSPLRTKGLIHRSWHTWMTYVTEGSLVSVRDSNYFFPPLRRLGRGPYDFQLIHHVLRQSIRRFFDRVTSDFYSASHAHETGSAGCGLAVRGSDRCGPISTDAESSATGHAQS